jgi:multimeric flavodoxin WrbA
MKAVILNGARAGDEGLAPIERLLTASLAGHGYEVEPIHLRDRTIAYCQGCFQCWMKTPGRCKTRDDAPDVSRAIVRSDLVVFLTPVTFGGYSSDLKKALDRSMGLLSPLFKRDGAEVRHPLRYAHYPSLLAIGVMDGRDDEEARVFTTLASRTALTLHSHSHLAGVVHRDEPGEAPKAVGLLVAQLVEARRGAA